MNARVEPIDHTFAVSLDWVHGLGSARVSLVPSLCHEGHLQWTFYCRPPQDDDTGNVPFCVSYEAASRLAIDDFLQEIMKRSLQTYYRDPSDESVRRVLVTYLVNMYDMNVSYREEGGKTYFLVVLTHKKHAHKSELEFDFG